MDVKGLISVNRFLQKLIKEIEAINNDEINTLIVEQKAAHDFLRSKKFSWRTKYFSNPVIRNLEEKVIPQKIEILTEYANRLPRIQRVIEILKKRKQRFLRTHSDEYKNILGLFKLVVKFLTKKKLIRILERELNALKKRRLITFLKISYGEYLLLRPFAHRLAKFDLHIDVKTFDKISIPARRINVIKHALDGTLLVALLFMNSAFASGQVAYAFQASTKGPPHCPEYHKVIEIRNEVFTSSEVIKHYQRLDMKREFAVEAEFEKMTGVNLVGEYTEKDITSIKSLLERTYGIGALKKYNIHTLVVLPKGTTMKLQGTSPYTACAGVRTRGFARRSGEIVMTTNESMSLNTSLFLHELSHHIHYNVQREHPEFDQKWKTFVGGYSERYGMKNIMEDVATVAEAVSIAQLEGKDLRSIKAVDGNQQALQAKIRLLFEYNFFRYSYRIFQF